MDLRSIQIVHTGPLYEPEGVDFDFGLYYPPLRRLAYVLSEREREVGERLIGMSVLPQPQVHISAYVGGLLFRPEATH